MLRLGDTVWHALSDGSQAHAGDASKGRRAYTKCVINALGTFRIGAEAPECQRDLSGMEIEMVTSLI
jgi:hypothetical protein